MRRLLLILLAFLSLISIAAVMAGTVSVTATTDRKIYYRGETVFITACVYEDGNPVSGATVAVEVRDPGNNVVYTFSKTTGADGCATFWFTLDKNAKPGIYKLYATTDYGGGASTEEPSMFVVNPTPVGGEALPVDKLALILNTVYTYSDIIVLAALIAIVSIAVARKIEK